MEKRVWEHISEKSGEKIIEWRTCIYTGENFPIFEKEKHILDKLGLPLPNMSPKSRFRNIYMMRNERHLYRRDCDLTGKNMLSVFPPEYHGKVFHFSEYTSDKWSAFDYGIDFDTSGDIHSQIYKFFTSIPRRSLNIEVGRGMENCDYSNYGLSSKDCYMCQTPAFAEKCYYSHSPFQSTYNFDVFLNEKCEISYESVYCINSYATFYCQYVEDSRDCHFCYEVIGCQNCIGCVGIDGKQYYILNEQVSEKQYQEKLTQIFSCYKNVQEFQKQFELLKSTIPKKAFVNKVSENVFGSTIRYSKNIVNSFVIFALEDSLHVTHAGVESSYLLSCDNGGTGSSYVYNSIGVGESTNSAYISFGGGNNSYYLYDSRDCNDCMFCAGIYNQQYCIFNKKYSQDEYKKLSKQLISTLETQGIWGNGFPVEMALFPYNDSRANDHFPVEKVVYMAEDNSVLKVENENKSGRGVVYVGEPDKFISKAQLDLGGESKVDILWRTGENKIDIPESTTILSAHQIPEIGDVTNDILSAVIICEETGKPFKLIAQELKFYKKHSLPIPRRHPETRYQDRFKTLPKYELLLRTCKQCNKETLTVWEEGDIICDNCNK